MKRNLLGRILFSLFALSIATAGFVFAGVAAPVPIPQVSCSNCDNVQLNCPGSPCNCQYSQSGNHYVCIRNH